MKRLGMASLGLAGLVGCASVLGFEDIVEEAPTIPDEAGSSSGSSSSSTSGNSTADAAPAKCLPAAGFENPRRIDELATEEGETVARLSSDERTIVFMRGGIKFEPYIARRSSNTEPFGMPIALPKTMLMPAITRDGTKIYFTDVSEGGKRILSYAPVDAPMNVTHRNGVVLGPADDLFVFRSDVTDETFYASNRERGDGQNLLAPYSIYRLSGSFDRTDLGAQPKKLELEHLTVSGPIVTEPVLSADGLDLYYTLYAQSKPASGDVINTPRAAYVASRASTSSTEFGEAHEIAGLNASSSDIRTRLSWVSDDNCRAYVYSTGFGPTVDAVFHLYRMDRVRR